MGAAIRTIGHEDRLSLVDHLEELRVRLIVSALALALAFGVCLWQNHALLRIINLPLERQTQKQVQKGNGPLGQTALAQQAVLKLAGEEQALVRALSAPASGLPTATRTKLAEEIPRVQADVARIPRVPQGNKPVTLGIGEPFTTTLTVTFCFALVASLPVILFELYGFVLPAFTPRERRIAQPMVAAIPLLFLAGVLFGYFVVLPAAVRFFQNFNSGEFNVLVQASQYYKFAATVLLAMGLVFQVPVAILAAARAGVVTPSQLRRSRRYALLACAVIAAFLPGDAITLVLETVPLYVLYEASILVAALAERRWPTDRAADATATGADRLPERVPLPGECKRAKRAAAHHHASAHPHAETHHHAATHHQHQRAALMLFDLRARGRRRTVRVIYIGLALIFLLGAVGAGVGGGFGSGGVFDIFTGNEGSSSASFSHEISKYKRLTQKEPRNAGAWEGLTKALLHEAGGEAYVSRTGVVSGKGKELYRQAAQAWESYVALNPAKPNLELAQLMVNIYGEQGLSEPAEAVKVLQLVVAARPSTRYYSELAENAYRANNIRIGDLATKKTLSLVPAAQRPRVKKELAELRKSSSGGQTYTTTTNGKTYTGKLSSNGEAHLSEAQTKTAPAGKSSTKK